jgi:hypothetical protein
MESVKVAIFSTRRESACCRTNLSAARYRAFKRLDNRHMVDDRSRGAILLKIVMRRIALT